MIRVLLAAVAVGLAGLLAYQWSRWPPPSPSREVQAAPAPGVLGADRSTGADPLSGLTPLDPLESYAAVTEQTLFRPERKPEEPEDEPKPESQPEDETSLDAMDLTAVIITPDLVTAWIRDPAQDELVDLKLGEDVAGWSVKEIRADRVLMERQGETSTIKLRDFSETRAAAPGANRPPSPVPTRRTPTRMPVTPPLPPIHRGRSPSPPRPLQTRPDVRRPLPQRPR